MSMIFFSLSSIFNKLRFSHFLSHNKVHKYKSLNAIDVILFFPLFRVNVFIGRCVGIIYLFPIRSPLVNFNVACHCLLPIQLWQNIFFFIAISIAPTPTKSAVDAFTMPIIEYCLNACAWDTIWILFFHALIIEPKTIKNCLKIAKNVQSMVNSQMCNRKGEEETAEEGDK